MINLNKTMGKNIKSYRLKRGYSLYDIEDYMEGKLTYNSLYQIELGKKGTKLENLILIAEILSVSLDDLIKE